MTAGRQIDHREAPMSQPQSAVDVDAVVIRPAMGDRGIHLPQQLRLDRALAGAPEDPD
jgi:hypothetical protein